MYTLILSFDNDMNRPVTAALLTNVQAVGESYSARLVKRKDI